MDLVSFLAHSHPTSCCSAAEIMAVLFFHTMRYKPQDPRNPHNDRFVLSKVGAQPAPLHLAQVAHGPGAVRRCWQRGISEGTSPLVSAWPQPSLSTRTPCLPARPSPTTWCLTLC